MVKEREWNQEGSSIRAIISQKGYHRKRARYYRKKLSKNRRYKNQKNWAEKQTYCKNSKKKNQAS